MPSLLPLLGAIAVAGTVVSATNQSFSEYLLSFGRNYIAGSKEYSMREAAFTRQLHLIQLQNAKPDALWKAGVNHLTDRFDAELRSLLGYISDHKRTGAQLIIQGNDSVQEPAESVDWGSLESAKFVKDQGECGSCWVVAAVGMLEARFEIAQGTTKQFSAQQLLDCVQNLRHCGGDGGCAGGTVELAMEYVAQQELRTDQDYPYLGKAQQCKATSLRTEHSESFLSRRLSGLGSVGVGLTLASWSTLTTNEPRALMLAVMEGPVAISAAANAWYIYQSGIFNSCSRNATVNHAVLLFGYGVENKVKYWRIRNSWGSTWGEQGYMRLLRHGLDEEQYCGIDKDPSKGYACLPYPESLPVCGMCGMLADSVSAHVVASRK